MSRIRSIHPEQWTDEDFVSLSFPARLLAIAIRNECDDKGVFEWKPVKIKMRLFPADNVDVSALLDELTEANICRQYECGGKTYGAVRNFRKFQRPKKPNDVHPMIEEMRDYVGLSGDGPEPEDDEVPEVPHQFPTSSEIPPQMEDGGGRVEEEVVLPRKRASRLTQDWSLPSEWGKWALSEGWLETDIRREADKFRDYWIAKPGRDGTKADWSATWRNWMRNSKAPKSAPTPTNPVDIRQALADRIKSAKPWNVRDISSAQVRDLLAAGLVTIEDCRKAGVA